jgi:hypothetical protein
VQNTLRVYNKFAGAQSREKISREKNRKSEKKNRDFHPRADNE